MKKLILSLSLLLSSTFLLNAQNVKSIIDNAITQMSKKNSYKYTFVSKERINGSYVNSTLETKLLQSPHKVYLNNTAGPNEGKELLYVYGQNKNKVLINTFINVSLSPLNSMIRKGNHYTVLEVGFGRVTKILIGARTRAAKEASFEKVFSYEGEVTFDGQKCYKIIINDPTFRYIDYTIKNGETLYQLAKRLNINEQLIIEKNSSLSGFGSGSDGMTIKIPSSYAKKSILYINKNNYHAVYQEMYDDKGQYEKYKFLNLKINPKFEADEFTEDFKEYGF